MKIRTPIGLLGLTLIASQAVYAGEAPSDARTAGTITIAQAEALEDFNRMYAERVLSEHEDIMPLLDKNGDGMCSRSEFMQAHQRIFDAVDANGDGQISEDEMQRFEQNIRAGSPSA